MDNDLDPKQSVFEGSVRIRRISVILMILIASCVLVMSAIYYYISWSGDSTRPVWSPDGRFIIYEFNGYLNSRLVVMDSNGRNKKVVAQCGGEKSPVWSPDSTRIAFSCIDSYGPAPLYTRNYSIIIVEADGSDQVKLIDGDHSNHSQQWSPDGNALVFVSNRDAEDPGPMDLMNWDIYLYSFHDREISRLTNSTYPDINPAWSPDSTRIAFVSDISGDGGTPVNGSDITDSRIKIINQEGEVLDVLTGSGTSLSWSPDGSLISFSNGQRIYSIEVESGKRTQLTPLERRCCPGRPAFSPAGNQIVFSDKHSIDDDYELYIANIADGSTHPLTSNEIDDFSPVWSPDGSTILFTSQSEKSSRRQVYSITPDGMQLACLTCKLWD